MSESELNAGTDFLTLEVPNLDAALEAAASHWGVRAEDIDAVVLDEGKRLFGLLSRKMKVRASLRAPLAHLKAREFASLLVENLGLDLKASMDPETRLINLDGEDSAIVIGRHGETLKALEFITNLIFRSDPATAKIRFDCGGYRARREESLIRLAESVARDVTRKNAPVGLEPMSSWERRIIHMALQELEGVETTSEGEEPLRRVIVRPANYTERHPQRRRFR